MALQLITGGGFHTDFAPYISCAAFHFLFSKTTVGFDETFNFFDTGLTFKRYSLGENCQLLECNFMGWSFGGTVTGFNHIGVYGYSLLLVPITPKQSSGFILSPIYLEIPFAPMLPQDC